MSASIISEQLNKWNLVLSSKLFIIQLTPPTFRRHEVRQDCLAHDEGAPDASI